MIILLEIIFIKVNIRYKLTYKKLVIQEFLKAYNENLNYYPTRRMESSTYCDAEFERFDKYHSEDYIQGNIDGMDIRLAEIRTKVETQDKEGNKSYSTVFHGLFATIQNQNSIKEKIYIRTDKGIFGNLLKKNRMELDSSEFEKYFDIYGENKIIIMQLLTSDIMEAMIEFKEKNNIKYEITIKNNNIYIRFHCGSMFEPKLFGNALDVDLLTKTYKIMNFVFDISKLITKTLKEIDV